MKFEKLIRNAFFVSFLGMIALRIFAGTPSISLTYFIVLAVSICFLGCLYLFLFAKRWWRSGENPVTWGQMIVACVAALIVITFARIFAGFYECYVLYDILRYVGWIPMILGLMATAKKFERPKRR